MCTAERLAALKEEVSAVLGSDDLPLAEKQEKLADLRRDYAACVRAHAQILADYGRKARGCSSVEAEAIAAELLAALAMFGGPSRDEFAALLAMMFPGVLSPGGSTPGFPLLPLSAPGWTYTPSWGRL